jgi:hypothetical protein
LPSAVGETSAKQVLDSIFCRDCGDVLHMKESIAEGMCIQCREAQQYGLEALDPDWESKALAAYVAFRKATSLTGASNMFQTDVHQFAVDFWALPEDEQKRWTLGVPEQFTAGVEAVLETADPDWESKALAVYVDFQSKNLNSTDVDQFAIDFVSLPEDEQRKWAFGVPSEYASHCLARIEVDPAIHNSLLSLREFAKTPTSKFLDLVALHVKTLISVDATNPRLIDLLKSIAWTGTQPGAPFDPESLEILEDWLAVVKPRVVQ